MKTSELTPALLKGELLAVGELLEWQDAKEFPAKDKQRNEIPGKFNVRSVAKVLLGTETVEVGDFLKVKRASEAPARPEWAKPRALVVLKLKGLSRTAYGVRADGEIMPLEA
jgi:hypothetical protein